MESGCWTEGGFHLLGWAAGHDHSDRDDKGDIGSGTYSSSC